MKTLLIFIIFISTFFTTSNEVPLKLKIRVNRKISNSKILTKVICTYINDSDSLYYLSNPDCIYNLGLLPSHGKIKLQRGYFATPDIECMTRGIALKPHSEQSFTLKEYLETMFQGVNSKDTTTLKIIYYGRIVSEDFRPINRILESNQIIVNY